MEAMISLEMGAKRDEERVGAVAKSQRLLQLGVPVGVLLLV